MYPFYRYLSGFFKIASNNDATSQPQLTILPVLCYGDYRLLFSLPAWAIDILPGMLRPREDGINFAQIIYVDSEFGDKYVRGAKQPGHPEIDTTLYQFRLGRYIELADYPALFYVHLPMGHVNPNGSLSQFEGDSGMGDAYAYFNVWPFANNETGTYLGIAAYLFAPTGSYDPKRRFNLGENRYRGALQIGYQSQLTENLNYMLAFDTTWYGKNSDFGPDHDDLTQDPLYAAQLALKYQFDPHFALSAGYFYISGGETSVNNISRNDSTRVHRYQISGFIAVPDGSIALQYGGDLKTENGYREDQRIMLRYTRFF